MPKFLKIWVVAPRSQNPPAKSLTAEEALQLHDAPKHPIVFNVYGYSHDDVPYVNSLFSSHPRWRDSGFDPSEVTYHGSVFPKDNPEWMKKRGPWTPEKEEELNLTATWFALLEEIAVQTERAQGKQSKEELEDKEDDRMVEEFVRDLKNELAGKSGITVNGNTIRRFIQFQVHQLAQAWAVKEGWVRTEEQRSNTSVFDLPEERQNRTFILRRLRIKILGLTSLKPGGDHRDKSERYFNFPEDLEYMTKDEVTLLWRSWKDDKIRAKHMGDLAVGVQMELQLEKTAVSGGVMLESVRARDPCDAIRVVYGDRDMP